MYAGRDGRHALPQRLRSAAADVERREGDRPGGLPVRQRVDAHAAAGRRAARHGLDPRGIPADAQRRRARILAHGEAGRRHSAGLRQLQLQTQRFRLPGSGGVERRFSKKHLRSVRRFEMSTVFILRSRLSPLYTPKIN